METAKASIIRLDHILLEKLEFNKTVSTLHRPDIPPNALRIQVDITETTPTTRESTCELTIFGGDGPAGDFSIQLVYNIGSSVEEPEKVEELNQFAKFGAPFNALVFARQLVFNLTASAFGTSVVLPLMDIREFGKKLNIRSITPYPTSPASTPLSPPTPPAAEHKE